MNLAAEADVRNRQLAWWIDLHTPRRGSDPCGPEVPGPTTEKKVDLLPITAPPGLNATHVRDLRLIPRWRKGLNVGLAHAGLVRVVCDPLGVGRELGLPFIKLRMQNGNRLAIRDAIFLERLSADTVSTHFTIF